MKLLYRTLMLLAVTATAMTAAADAPVGYYKTLDGKSGQALKTAVRDITLKHTVVSYNSLWNYFPSTDCYPDNKSRVWDMYSDKSYYFNGTWSVSGMNREHSLPKSWWGGYDVSDGYVAYTDLNHLYPSDAEANTAKLHYPLGEVSTVTFNNGCTKTGAPKSGQGGGSAVVFEPDDRYKGDFARTYFYMAATYSDYTWKYTYMMTNSDWKTLNSWSISMLLRWHRQDPVSEKERLRNDAVQRSQNNRNPFIDNPDLVEYIWGDKQGQVYNGDGGEDPGTPTLISPTQGTEFNFGEVALGKSLQLTIYVKGEHLTSNLSVQVYSGDKAMFTIPVSRIERTAANSDGGYPLTITYTPTAIGNHTSKVLVSDGGIVGSVAAVLNGSCLAVPMLTAITAMPASNITDTGYTANWQASTDVVDYYIVNRIVYDSNNNIISNESFTTEETSYTFDDRKPGETHTYTVQSSRLGYTSVESNVITIDATGISGIDADLPLQAIAGDGYVLFKCGTALHDVVVYNTAGQVVRHLSEVHNDDTVDLPAGVYIITSSSSNSRIKLVVF